MIKKVTTNASTHHVMINSRWLMNDKGYIYFEYNELCSKWPKLFSYIITSLGKRFALGILRCLISNVLINYYYKSLFYLKQITGSDSISQAKWPVLLVLKLPLRRQTRSSLRIVVTSDNNLFVMQDYVALSKPEVLLNYFKPIQYAQQ
jgi:hypothetical protein